MRSLSFFYQNNTSVARKKRTNPFVLSAAADAARLAIRGYIGKGKLWFIREQWLNTRAERPGTRPGRHSSNGYGSPAKLKVMVGVEKMNVKVVGGVGKVNVNVMGGAGCE